MSDKKERRRERLRLEDEQKKDESLKRPRRRDEALFYRGAGRPVVQVSFWDAWQPLHCWEIRDLPGYCLFHSVSQLPDSALLVGDQQLEIEPGTLQTYAERLFALSVPLGVPHETRGVLDGCSYEVCLFVGIQSHCRFSWIGGCATATWADLEVITTEMVGLFLTLKPSNNGADTRE